ncbi:MAG: helix-turn-helix transcriptional regulator [Candidatus Aminicenantes bacterium]|nr:helix-turn-helix transcriptional regulator [Candidatus Aminicenantes bacterium]
MDINLDTSLDDLIRENLKDIGARIKDIRKRLRISQLQMAETIKITNSYLSDIETGKGNPGHSFFFKLAKLYDVNLNYLFLGKGEIFLETTRPTDSDDPNFPNIRTTEDLCWYMVRSPLFRHQILGFAAKLRYESKNLIEMDMEDFHSIKVR